MIAYCVDQKYLTSHIYFQVFSFQLHIFMPYVRPLVPSSFLHCMPSAIKLSPLPDAYSLSRSLLRLSSCGQMKMLPTAGSHCPAYTPLLVLLSSDTEITPLSVCPPDSRSLKAGMSLFISISLASSMLSGTGGEIRMSSSLSGTEIN